MHALFIALGVIAYLQAGRFLGWYCHRTWHKSLRWGGEFTHTSSTGGGTRGGGVIWYRNDKGLAWAFRVLFPWIAVLSGSSEMIEMGHPLGYELMVFDTGPSKFDVYKWTMIFIWPIKIIWIVCSWSLILPAVGLQRTFIALTDWPSPRPAKTSQEIRVQVAADTKPLKVRELEALEKKRVELTDVLTSVRTQADALRGSIELDQGPAMRSPPLVAKRDQKN